MGEVVSIVKGELKMNIERIEQAISDLKHLAEYGEIFAYQNESIEISIKSLEKQIPVAITCPNGNKYCPSCNKIVGNEKSKMKWKHCPNCGQAIKELTT